MSKLEKDIQRIISINTAQEASKIIAKMFVSKETKSDNFLDEIEEQLLFRFGFNEDEEGFSIDVENQLKIFSFVEWYSTRHKLNNSPFRITFRKMPDQYDNWYSKKEMFDLLKRNRYSDNIAEELSGIWASLLQGALKKGFEVAHGQMALLKFSGTFVEKVKKGAIPVEEFDTLLKNVSAVLTKQYKEVSELSDLEKSTLDEVLRFKDKYLN